MGAGPRRRRASSRHPRGRDVPRRGEPRRNSPFAVDAGFDSRRRPWHLLRPRLRRERQRPQWRIERGADRHAQWRRLHGAGRFVALGVGRVEARCRSRGRQSPARRATASKWRRDQVGPCWSRRPSAPAPQRFRIQARRQGTFYARVIAGSSCGALTASAVTAFSVAGAPPGSGPRTPDPPPGQRLPLPNMSAVVDAVAQSVPGRFAQLVP